MPRRRPRETPRRNRSGGRRDFVPGRGACSLGQELSAKELDQDLDDGPDRRRPQQEPAHATTRLQFQEVIDREPQHRLHDGFWREGTRRMRLSAVKQAPVPRKTLPCEHETQTRRREPPTA